MITRGSGILLHITSLPSAFGIGDLGPAARRFVDFLASAGQSYWQILPLNPTDGAGAHSPYHSDSAFAGNPLLISPEDLVTAGYLTPGDLAPFRRDENGAEAQRVDFSSVETDRADLLDRAFKRFRRSEPPADYHRFRSDNRHWLDDFVRFEALKARFDGRPWIEWPDGVRNREPDALADADADLAEAMDRSRFFQYLFGTQWAALRAYANERGVKLMGDIPIYVIHDSVDVWAGRDLFQLDPNGRPTAVSGVPPDYFSDTGQLWGHPLYNWDRIRETGYEWWVRRMARNLALTDWVRVDHFRGLVAYWEVPADAETAISGRWVDAPAKDFFSRLSRRFSCLPVIAEDLGVITPDVREMMRRFRFPGMKLLLFAFGDDLPKNPYAPHNHVPDCVVYTGTHDNNTARGWLETEATDADKARLARYLGRSVPVDEIADVMVRLAMQSVANLCIIPMQDVLGSGADARMNRPAITEGNWVWRVREDQLTEGVAESLAEMTAVCGRG